jgi:hypothetical protein
MMTLATPWPSEEPYVLPEETAWQTYNPGTWYKPNPLYYPDQTHYADPTTLSRRTSTTTITVRTITRTLGQVPTARPANSTATGNALSASVTADPLPETSTVAVREPSTLANPFEDDDTFDVLYCEDPFTGSEPSLVSRRSAENNKRTGAGPPTESKYNASCTTREARSLGTGADYHHRPAVKMGGSKARPAETPQAGSAAGLVAGTGALAAAAVFLAFML